MTYSLLNNSKHRFIMTLCKCQIIFVPCRKCQKFTNHQILKSVKSRGLACKYERAYNICHISAAIQYIDNVSVLKRGHLGLPKTEKDRKKISCKLDIFTTKIFPYFHWMHRHFWSPCIPFKYKPWCDGGNNFADYNWQMGFTPGARKGNIGWVRIKIYVHFRHFYIIFDKTQKTWYEWIPGWGYLMVFRSGDIWDISIVVAFLLHTFIAKAYHWW